jgi:hypothetical protein
MPLPALLAAASSAQSALSGIKSLLNPGAARDDARKKRRDFFLAGAQGGSVTAARHLLGGLQHVASHEIGWYNEAAQQMENGDTLAQETWANAKQLGPLWEDGADPYQNVVNLRSPIERELSVFINNVRNDASATVGAVAAGMGSQAASAVAGNGSRTSTVLVPTTSSALVVGGLLLLMLLALAIRKR